MDLTTAKTHFQDILRSLNVQDKPQFLHWIADNWQIEKAQNDVARNTAVERLELVSAQLRSIMPESGILESETIIIPAYGPDSDLDAKTTVHVDEFLYDDETLDGLVDDGKFSRHYCHECNSRNVKLLNIISHSTSIDRICWLFTAMLPPLQNQKILDIGSRLGAVLYGSYLFTTDSHIVGVEMNSDFCKIQNEIINRFNFQDRIHIVCDNILNQGNLLTEADITIMNNTFEFFLDQETNIKCWRFVAQHLKPGSILVTVPYLETTFSYLEVGFELRDWVEELSLYNPDAENIKDPQLHLESMKHYRVLRNMFT